MTDQFAVDDEDRKAGGERASGEGGDPPTIERAAQIGRLRRLRPAFDHAQRLRRGQRAFDAAPDLGRRRDLVDGGAEGGEPGLPGGDGGLRLGVLREDAGEQRALVGMQRAEHIFRRQNFAVLVHDVCSRQAFKESRLRCSHVLIVFTGLS